MCKHHRSYWMGVTPLSWVMSWWRRWWYASSHTPLHGRRGRRRRRWKHSPTWDKSSAHWWRAPPHRNPVINKSVSPWMKAPPRWRPESMSSPSMRRGRRAHPPPFHMWWSPPRMEVVIPIIEIKSMLKSLLKSSPIWHSSSEGLIRWLLSVRKPIAIAHLPWCLTLIRVDQAINPRDSSSNCLSRLACCRKLISIEWID